MHLSLQTALQQPMIVKYSQPYRSGLRTHNLSRHGIGFVLRGKKHIYQDDSLHEVNRGDIFFLNAGMHYWDDIPEDNRPFEQIIFFYTPEQIGRIISHLSMTYHLTIDNNHSCEKCRKNNYVISQASNTIRNFFTTTNQYIKDELFTNDETAENIKMTELIYLIVSQKDSCIKNKILCNIDEAKEVFEKTIMQHIFTDISIEDLAKQTHRSLTSFKKEFRRHFSDPPHKWFIKQRLAHARMLLITTEKSVSEVGIECNFPNTSHFIKLFKKEYGTTPSNYRSRYADDSGTELYPTEAKVREPLQQAQ